MQAQIPDAAERTGQVSRLQCITSGFLILPDNRSITGNCFMHLTPGVVVTDRRGYGTDTLFYAYEHLGLIRCRKSSSFFYKNLAGAGIGMLTG